MSLLAASEALSFFPVLDLLLICELLERDGHAIDFHRYYATVCVGMCGVALMLSSLEWAGVT